MKRLLDRITFKWIHHPHPANDPDTHMERVSAAREQLGDKYICHPANRARPIWRGPVCLQG